MSIRMKFAHFLRNWAKKIDKTETERNNLEDGAVLMRSMLSHNVRMPLSIIGGYGKLLSQGIITDKEKEKEILNKLCENITYLNNVISLIIDGNERAGVNYKFEEINLVKCVRETMGYVKETAKRFNINLNVVCPKEEILIYADYTQIMRIVFNLFENSVKYMQRPGTITVTVDSPQPNEAYVIFKDDGVGMPAHEVPMIMQKGFRSETAKDIPGSGMGMYYVKEVVEGHKGSLEVTSDLDKGMCVTIKFKATIC